MNHLKPLTRRHAALADPENPSRMKAEYQSDWVHPNDAGYQKMAETAAAFFKTAE